MKCRWCGEREATQIHHKVPRYAGGTDDPDNLENICVVCHRHYHKYNGDFARWGMIGGLTTVWKHGNRHMKAIAVRGGKKGGATLKRTRGSEYFREIGRKGALARARKMREKDLEWLF